METYIGHCNTKQETPVVGKLIFPERGEFPATRGACLAVLPAGTPLPEETEIVGAIRLDDPECPLETSAPLSCPVLTLPELPQRHHGQIALLDPRQATLFVSPDLVTVNRYAQALRSDPCPADCEHPPLHRSGIISSAEEMIRPHEDGWLLRLTSQESTDADALYDHCCEVADRAVGASVTVILPWDRQNTDSSALRDQLRALFRSAVYGRFSLLFQGPLTNEDCESCLRESHRAFCELESEGREFNGYIPKGVLIDSPLSLMTNLSLSAMDLLCFDLPRLGDCLTGKRPWITDSILTGQIATLLSRFADKHPSLRRTAILPTANDLSEWNPLLASLTIEEVFFSEDNR